MTLTAETREMKQATQFDQVNEWEFREGREFAVIDHLEGREGSPYRAESRAGRRNIKSRETSSRPNNAGSGFLPPINQRGQGGLGDPFGPEAIR